MISVVVTLRSSEVGRLIKMFKQHGDSDGHIARDLLKDSDRTFMDGMASEGFVERFVSDWGMQEESYGYTEHGYLITRTQKKLKP